MGTDWFSSGSLHVQERLGIGVYYCSLIVLDFYLMSSVDLVFVILFRISDVDG